MYQNSFLLSQEEQISLDSKRRQAGIMLPVVFLLLLLYIFGGCPASFDDAAIVPQTDSADFSHELVPDGARQEMVYFRFRMPKPLLSCQAVGALVVHNLTFTRFFFDSTENTPKTYVFNTHPFQRAP